jgi:hypothetical protein
VGGIDEKRRGADLENYGAEEMKVKVRGDTKTLVKTPGYRDILLGRGRGIQTANGNYLMRQIVASHRTKYCSLMRQDRRKYSEAVLEEVLATGARFLQRTECDEGEYWVPVDREAAHDKVSHSLREKRPSREHNIGDPLPPGHLSAQPEVPVPTRRRRAAPRPYKQDNPSNKPSDLPDPAAASSLPQLVAAHHTAQHIPHVPPEVAATTALLLQAIQSQAQQQQLLSSMVQNMNQLQHAQQPNYVPQLDLTSQLSQLQAIAALNNRGTIPVSYLLSQPQIQHPHPPSLQVSLPNLLATQHQLGFAQGGGMPVAANLNAQPSRSNHQTVVGRASLNNLPNHQTQYASSILLQALMAANQTSQTSEGAPQGNNNNNTNDSGLGAEGGSRFAQL